MSLKRQLQGKDMIVAPGVYAPLTALLVEQAGFSSAYISGASVSYTLLGRPDLGFVSLSQLADVVQRIRQRVSLNLIVDADTGFGNALNVQQTIRTLEQAGANAIQIEDQDMPKRCGHLKGKRLVSGNEMCGKIRAACEARTDPNTLIIARTDALSVIGIEASLSRAKAYADAGADLLFVEGLQKQEDIDFMIQGIRQGSSARIPLLANMVDGGDPRTQNAQALEAAGFSVAITAGSLARAMVYAAEELLQNLHTDGSTIASKQNMLDFAELNERLGLAQMLAAGDRYAEQRGALG